MFRSVTLCLISLFLYQNVSGQDYHTIESDIKNGKVSLHTRLLIPEKAIQSPPPVLVLIHGSGKDTHWQVYQTFVKRLVKSGFAVAFYDKRGTGSSTGKYLNISIKRSWEVFNTLANDAAIVADWVNKQEGIDKGRIGFFAMSQGGWIAPVAIKQSDAIDFSIIMSGPVTSLGHEKHYSRLAGDEQKKSQHSETEIEQMIKGFKGPFGYDSTPELSDINVPVLWLFGAKDRSVPVKLSIKNLQGVIRERKKEDFEYILYPKGNHSLFEAGTEIRLDYISDIKQWLNKLR